MSFPGLPAIHMGVEKPRRFSLQPQGCSARRRGSRSCHYVTSSRFPRLGCGRVALTGGALSHGCSKEKNLALARRHASQPPGIAERGPCRLRQLRRAEASASCLRALRALRWPRSCCRRQGPQGHGSGLILLARCRGLAPASAPDDRQKPPSAFDRRKWDLRVVIRTSP